MLSRRFLLAATAAFTLASALPAFAEDALHVSDPYARSTGKVGASGAVFLHLMNHGTTDDRLIAAKSDVAAKVELHTHTLTAEGVMQMHEIEGGVPLPAGASHAFERGADHVMLMGLTRALKDGDTFPLTLVFDSGAEVTIDVPVDNQRKPGEGGMEDHDHSAMGG